MLAAVLVNVPGATLGAPATGRLLNAISSLDDVTVKSLKFIDPHLNATQSAGGDTRAFLIVRNLGSTSDELLQVSCTCAKTAQLVRVVTDAKGIATPVSGRSVKLLPYGRLELTGRRYIQLGKLTAATPVGAKISMTLTFKSAGPIAVEFLSVDRKSDPTKAAAA